MLRKMYHSFALNLGIKKYLQRNIFDHISRLVVKIRFFFDSHIILALSKFLDDYIFHRVVEHYGADYKWDDEKSQNLDKNTHNYGYGLFHYSMIRNQRPSRVLCVGSMYGYIPFMCAKACEHNQKGIVDFVDAGFNVMDSSDEHKHYYGQGFWKKDSIYGHFSYLLDVKYIRCYITTTAEFAKKYPDRKYDYIHLDGDHSYKGAKLDYQLFWKQLNKGGFIIFHDIHLKKEFLDEAAQEFPLEYGYRKIWQKLIKSNNFKFELSNEYSGLGYIQKL